MRNLHVNVTVKSIQELHEVVDLMGSSLQYFSAHIDPDDNTEPAPAAEPETAPATEPETALATEPEPAPEPEPVYDSTTVREALKSLLVKHGTEASRAILEKHGVTKFPDLKPEHYASVMRAVEEAM